MVWGIVIGIALCFILAGMLFVWIYLWIMRRCQSSEERIDSPRARSRSKRRSSSPPVIEKSHKKRDESPPPARASSKKRSKAKSRRDSVGSGSEDSD